MVINKENKLELGWNLVEIEFRFKNFPEISIFMRECAIEWIWGNRFSARVTSAPWNSNMPKFMTCAEVNIWCRSSFTRLNMSITRYIQNLVLLKSGSFSNQMNFILLEFTFFMFENSWFESSNDGWDFRFRNRFS